MDELDVALEAAHKAGEILMGQIGQVLDLSHSKTSYNLVTQADLDAERAICQCISKAFPEHTILGEELHEADRKADHLWVVDPLDGTNNFVHGLPQFAVSIAYCRHGEPQCGVVYQPATGDCYTARRGGGAFRNGTKVTVATHTRLDEVLVGVGFYYDRGAMMEATLRAIADFFRCHIHGVRRFGSAALDLCLVGCGNFGVFFEYELSPWDFAAGWLFVEEAGGKVTTCAGERLTLEKSSLLASNGYLHEAALAVVRQHLPKPT